MEEQKSKERKGNKEYKKLKKLLKKAYKASFKENQLAAYIENAKKNFPGYTDAEKAYGEASKSVDPIQCSVSYNHVISDFRAAYSGQIAEYRKTREKARRLRILVIGKLSHAGRKESEEE